MHASDEGNALVLGGVALLAGVGLGLALPPTRRESELVGERSRAFQEEVKSVGRELGRDVRGITKQAAHEANERAREAGRDIEVIASDAAEETQRAVERELSSGNGRRPKRDRNHPQH